MPVRALPRSASSSALQTPRREPRVSPQTATAALQLRVRPGDYSARHPKIRFGVLMPLCSPSILCKVRLELRKPLRTGQTQLVLEPEAFLRRLFAIIPPPRWHLTRFHGVFSGHHRLRKKLAALLPKEPAPPSLATTPANGPAETDEGLLPKENSDDSRLSYAKLLSRVFEGDIGNCQRCGGALRFIACIDDPDTIGKILTHMALATDAPKLAPARGPPQAELADWDSII